MWLGRCVGLQAWGQRLLPSQIGASQRTGQGEGETDREMARAGRAGEAGAEFSKSKGFGRRRSTALCKGESIFLTAESFHSQLRLKFRCVLFRLVHPVTVFLLVFLPLSNF